MVAEVPTVEELNTQFENPDGTRTRQGIVAAAKGHMNAYFGRGFVLRSAEWNPKDRWWDVRLGHESCLREELVQLLVSEFGTVISAPLPSDVYAEMRLTHKLEA